MRTTVLGRAGLMLALVLLATSDLKADDTDKELRKKALALNEATGDAAISGKIVALVKDPAGTKPLLAIAAKMTKEKDQPFNVNATWILARTAQLLRDYDNSKVFYRLHVAQAKSLGSEDKIVDAYGGLIQMLYDAKKYDEAEKVCQEFMELKGDDKIESYKPLIQRRSILIQVKKGNTEEALRRCDNLIKAQPDNWLNLELKARVHREAGNFDSAAKIYEDVIGRAAKDERLTEEERKEFANEMRYSLSGLYIDAGKVDKAIEVLRALVKSEPDNPTYNNDLGYILADHDMNLDEAEKLVKTALEEDKKQRLKEDPTIKEADYLDNAAFLDSMGWVLYKQKKYAEAKKFLVQATAQPEGQHVEILDHLADVYLALKDKDNAVKTWKRAVEFAGDSKREQEKKAEIEKKIKANQ